MRVAINGFGRIGRLVARQLNNVVAINDIMDVPTREYLYKHDSIQGRHEGTLDGILQLRVPEIEDLPWLNLDIDLVIEATGKYTGKDKILWHITGSAKRVLITCPMPDADITLFMGVNELKYVPSKHYIISAGSCTANCVAPVLDGLDRTFGVESAYLVNLNAVTPNQTLVDSPHPDHRRGRNALLNIIPTQCTAVPCLKQVFSFPIDGMAFRVPVACGSVCHITAELKQDTSKQEVNDALAAMSTPILGYSEEELVSSDIVGDTHSCIVDGLCTQVDGKRAHIVAWYDNEMGFAARVADLVRYIGKEVKS